MSGSRRYVCRRSLRSELARLVLVLSVPVALASVFPRRAVGFTATRPAASRPPVCAFVSLTETEAAAVLAASRAAWQVDPGDVRTMRIDLSIDALPDGPVVPMMAERPPSAVIPRSVRWAPSLMPSGCVAPAPVRIPVQASDAREDGAFSREELLRIE